MKYILLIALAWFAAGCTYWDTAKTVIATEGAKAADRALESSYWGECEAATTGAVKRRYGGDPDAWDLYWKHCNPGKGVPTPPLPSPEEAPSP